VRIGCVSIALLLAASTLSAADPPVVAVVEVPRPPAPKWVQFKSDAGRQITLSAGAPAKWVAVDDGCDLVPAPDAKQATFSAPHSGRYRLVCVTADGPVLCAIEVGDGPPDPRPGPGPVPVDPLAAKLRAAFFSDPEPMAARREHARDLAELYRQAAALAVKPELVTSADLLSRIKAASATLVGADTLKEVRRVVAIELAAVLAVDAPLTAEQRKLVAALFDRMATVLESI
jgi:hypothetical protein